MNRKFFIGVLAASLIACAVIYVVPLYRLQNAITASEWKSKSVIVFSELNIQQGAEDVPPLSKVEVFSNTRYLRDGVFIKVTHINVFKNGNDAASEPPVSVEFTESGQWEMHGNYLFLTDTEITNVPTNRSLGVSKEQINELRDRLLTTEQQSSRVEIINERSILLTSLNQDSLLLHAN
ncbi:regulatory protein ToxS [Reinekea marinisedimentorum]|uniref:Transmembrane regulatory protein ToxS n=1 Tax=Reinekea marinisedimentorum TaxID=230495 RepID=A0A4V2UJK8_9GAMM|nr:regulatory protein ToxS [Reinekea marinisedimentorum]TCS40202.1 transmembrane regulatory protein ToxS [Reinekea marinisedimentorum]